MLKTVISWLIRYICFIHIVWKVRTSQYNNYAEKVHTTHLSPLVYSLSIPINNIFGPQFAYFTTKCLTNYSDISFLEFFSSGWKLFCFSMKICEKKSMLKIIISTPLNKHKHIIQNFPQPHTMHGRDYVEVRGSFSWKWFRSHTNRKMAHEKRCALLAHWKLTETTKMYIVCFLWLKMAQMTHYNIIHMLFHT